MADEYQKVRANRTDPQPAAHSGGTKEIIEVGKPAEPTKATGTKTTEQLNLAGLAWSDEIPSQKWMNFYTKVPARFAAGRGLKLRLSVEVKPDGGLSKQKLEETKAALRELGLDEGLTSL